MDKQVKDIIRHNIRVKEALLEDEALLGRVQRVIDACVNTFRRNGKVLFCGNGGSAADAQHLAAELSGRFYFDREPLFAEALHVNTSFLTAVANDYSYEEAFARLVRAAGRKGDVLFALSTSGNSANILRAAETAQKIGMTVVAMTGETGGKLRFLCHHLINVPSADTPRIQECHLLLGHIICQQVEAVVFPA
jgi:D-sedoheptulose 7-phosphate isomerase